MLLVTLPLTSISLISFLGKGVGEKSLHLGGGLGQKFQKLRICFSDVMCEINEWIFTGVRSHPPVEIPLFYFKDPVGPIAKGFLNYSSKYTLKYITNFILHII